MSIVSRKRDKQDRFDDGVAFERFRGPVAGYKGDAFEQVKRDKWPRELCRDLEKREGWTIPDRSTQMKLNLQSLKIVS